MNSISNIHNEVDLTLTSGVQLDDNHQIVSQDVSFAVDSTKVLFLKNKLMTTAV